MDIEGLGDKLVDQLGQRGLVRDYRRSVSADARQARRTWSGWGKSPRRICSRRSRPSKTAGWPGCSTPFDPPRRCPGGERCWPNSSARWSDCSRPTVEELADTPEIGPVIADSVHDFLHSDFGASDRRPASAGRRHDGPATAAAGRRRHAGRQDVRGHRHARKYTRDEIQALIAQHGGQAARASRRRPTISWPAKRPAASSTRPRSWASRFLMKQGSTACCNERSTPRARPVDCPTPNGRAALIKAQARRLDIGDGSRRIGSKGIRCSSAVEPGIVRRSASTATRGSLRTAEGVQ